VESETPSLLSDIKEIIQNIEPFTAQHIHDILHSHIENNKLNMGAVMVPIRIALVGTTKGPDLQVIMEIIGKDEVMHRIQQALALIKLP
jgi:glutamyl-tRNA synthetase